MKYRNDTNWWETVLINKVMENVTIIEAHSMNKDIINMTNDASQTDGPNWVNRNVILYDKFKVVDLDSDRQKYGFLKNTLNTNNWHTLQYIEISS